MPRILRWVLAGVSLPLAAGSLPASAQEYPFEIPKKDPAAMRSWRAVVPGEFHRMSWITNFDGTASPIDTVTLHNRTFYYGEVCMPHNCAGNVVAFLAAKGGREAYGALASDAIGVRHRYFGAPDAEARALLDQKLGQ
jgi:hypothetical protein